MEGLEGSSDPPIDIEVSAGADQSLTVSIAGELDMHNVGQLESRVAPELDRHPSRLILDVRELTFADTSAIALWLRWAAAVQRVELREPQPLLRKVIISMGLGSKLGLEP